MFDTNIVLGSVCSDKGFELLCHSVIIRHQVPLKTVSYCHIVTIREQLPLKTVSYSIVTIRNHLPGSPENRSMNSQKCLDPQVTCIDTLLPCTQYLLPCTRCLCIKVFFTFPVFVVQLLESAKIYLIISLAAEMVVAEAMGGRQDPNLEQKFLHKRPGSHRQQIRLFIFFGF